MAEEKKEKVEKKEGGFNAKLIIFGLPLFVIQLIAVYFITANYLMDKFVQNANYENIAEDVEIVEQIPEDEAEDSAVLFPINDLVVNPLSSRGERLLLVSLAFELEDEESMKKLAEKDIIVKDKIINLLSQKTQKELSNPSYKDTLKLQLSSGIKTIFPDVEVKNIYFSKFIID